MATAIIAFLVAIAPAMVEILKAILAKQAEEATTNAALTRRSLDELRTATDGVLNDPPVQPGGRDGQPG